MNYEEIKQLAVEHGVRVADLCALAPKNDPFYTGRPAEIAAAQWFAEKWQRFGYKQGVHLRRVHYQLQAQNPPVPLPWPLSWSEEDPQTKIKTELTTEVYINNYRCWDWLTEAGKAARYLSLVPSSAFEDRRNPDPLIYTRWSNPNDPFYDDPSPRIEIATYHSYQLLADYQLPDLPALPDLPSDLPDLPDLGIKGYETIEQDYHLEIWCEKSTINDVLLPLCQQYQVNFITGLGEMSITACLEFLNRVRQAGRPARLFYISDFDPAGYGMPVSVARKIEFFQRNEGYGDLDIQLQPICLTIGQIQHYNLPRSPIKNTERKRANFEAAHGEGAVELDSMEALHPGQLRLIIEQYILNYYDPNLRRRARNIKSQAEDEVNDLRQAVLDDYIHQIDDLTTEYQAILGDYSQTQEQFNDLVAPFQAQLEQYRHRLEDIGKQVNNLYGRISKQLEVEVQVGDPLDNYPLPQPELPDEPDSLYNSQRDYMEQLEAYKAQRNGNGAGFDKLNPRY